MRENSLHCRLEQSESLINQFSGDEIVSKFEFFENNHHWKMRG
jgi:hypothetical protein